MIPISWDAVHFILLGYMGGKVLLMEHENNNLVSTESKDSIGVQEFHSWEEVHQDCHCIHWVKYFKESNNNCNISLQNSNP